jgi:hypothetical protein
MWDFLLGLFGSVIFGLLVGSVICCLLPKEISGE